MYICAHVMCTCHFRFVIFDIVFSKWIFESPWGASPSWVLCSLTVSRYGHLMSCLVDLAFFYDAQLSVSTPPSSVLSDMGCTLAIGG